MNSKKRARFKKESGIVGSKKKHLLEVRPQVGSGKTIQKHRCVAGRDVLRPSVSQSDGQLKKVAVGK